MLSRVYVCESCNEPAGDNNRQHVFEVAYGGMDGSKVWHFRCLSMDGVISGKLPLSVSDLVRYNTWHISRLIKENTALRQRTDTLADEVERLMRANGASGQEISDFLAGFSFYD